MQIVCAEHAMTTHTTTYWYITICICSSAFSGVYGCKCASYDVEHVIIHSIIQPYAVRLRCNRYRHLVRSLGVWWRWLCLANLLDGEIVNLLGNDRELGVDRLRVVVQRRRFAQNHERAEHAGRHEQPEEQPVHHHGNEAPVLIFLQA